MNPGDQLGPYRIEAPIGAGGMGAVWKARDTRLDRTVAIKTIEGHFSERFEREAKTIASLNHPHICTLHDVGENYLVMEYIEGAPLKGPLPLSEVVKLGSQIAEALDAAHRKGITHRDLKPANILVTKSGGAKVIDFGLAKGGSPVRGEQDVTLTKPLTGEGTILGTIPYMSPEQLQGHEADARSDIFALGCVLYEMLTGRRAFDGKSQVSIMAAILEHEPAPLTEPATPAWMDRIIRRCLRKNPDDRWQNARDIAIELREPPPEQPAARPAPTFSSPWRWIAIVAGVAALAASIGWRAARAVVPPSSPVPNAALSISLPEDTQLAGAIPNLALSPDASTLAMPLSSAGESRVYIRPLDSHSWRALPGTEGARRVFWSPDSTQIGFITYDKLKRIDFATGQVRVLTDIIDVRLGTTQNPIWSPDGKIYFRQAFDMIKSGLYMVPDSGGTPKLEYEANLIRPYTVLLPSGVLLEAGLDGKAAAYSLRDGKLKALEGRLVNSRFEFVPESPGALSGHILHGAGSRLFARPFDAASLSFRGDDVPLVDTVDLVFNVGDYRFSGARNGMLAYLPPQARRMVWRDRTGKQLGAWPALSWYDYPRISPDGRQVAYSLRDQDTGAWHGYIAAASGENARRLDRSSGWIRHYWSPDGKQLASANVVSTDSRHRTIVVRAASPAGGQTKSWQLPNNATTLDWFPDGQAIVYNTQATAPNEIWGQPLAEGGRPFLIGQGTDASFSPDGKFIAFRGGSGYQLKRYPITNDTWPLLPDAQGLGSWRQDGREFFCIRRAGDRDELVAVPVRLDSPQPEVGEPKVLFEVPYTGARIGFHVTGDGQRFLVILPDTSKPPVVRVLTNWRALLKLPQRSGRAE